MLKRKEMKKSNKTPKIYTKKEIDNILKETRFIDCGNGYVMVEKINTKRSWLISFFFILKAFNLLVFLVE